MSTYNGKDYLREQIDSILSQDCEEKADVKLKLLIRDDGSKDGTQEILRKYAAKYPTAGGRAAGADRQRRG